MFQHWLDRFRDPTDGGESGGVKGTKQSRGHKTGMFVRLHSGKRVEMPDADSVQPGSNGGLVFFDKNHVVVREFSWPEIMSYGLRR